jgi:hypothetical protein
MSALGLPTTRASIYTPAAIETFARAFPDVSVGQGAIQFQTNKRGYTIAAIIKMATESNDGRPKTLDQLFSELSRLD